MSDPRAHPLVIPDCLLSKAKEHEEDDGGRRDRPEEEVDLLEGAVSELDCGELADAREVGVHVRPADVRVEARRDVDVHGDGGEARSPNHLRERHGNEQKVAPRGQRGVAAVDVGREVEALRKEVVEGES